MPRPKKKANNKTAFVKSLPASMPGPEIVKKARDAGLNIGLNYVYSIRSRMNPKRTRKAAPAVPPTSPLKRGPGRPRKSASSIANDGGTAGIANKGGLEAEIERIVERKVTELLKARLGALFG